MAPVRSGQLGVLSLPAFVDLVARTTGRNEASLDVHADLERALGFDAVERYLLVRVVLDGGLAFDEERLASVSTLADAHRLLAVEQAVAPLAVSGRGPERRRPTGVPMQGDAVWLRVPTSADYEWMHALLTHPVNLSWAPLNGQAPSPPELMASLGATSLCQFVIVANGSGRPCGWVRAASADLHNGHAYLEAVLDPDARDAGWPLEGVAMVVDQLFTSWRLRKVYVEIPEPQWAGLSTSTRSRIEQEGVLHNHRFAVDQWCDVHLCVIRREQWDRFAGNGQLPVTSTLV